MSGETKTVPQTREPKVFFESILVVSSGSDESDVAEENHAAHQYDHCPTTTSGMSDRQDQHPVGRGVQATDSSFRHPAPQKPSEPPSAGQGPPPARLSFRRAYQASLNTSTQGPASPSRHGQTPHHDGDQGNQIRAEDPVARGGGHASREHERHRQARDFLTPMSADAPPPPQTLYSYRPTFAERTSSPPPSLTTQERRQAAAKPSPTVPPGATPLVHRRDSSSPSPSPEPQPQPQGKVLPTAFQPATPKEASPPSPSPPASINGRPASFHALQMGVGHGFLARNEDSGLVDADDTSGATGTTSFARLRAEGTGESFRKVGSGRSSGRAPFASPGPCPIDGISCTVSEQRNMNSELLARLHAHLPCLLQTLAQVQEEQQRLRRHVCRLEKQGEVQARLLREVVAAAQEGNHSGKELHPRVAQRSGGWHTDNVAAGGHDDAAEGTPDGVWGRDGSAERRCAKVLAEDLATPNPRGTSGSTLREQANTTAATSHSREGGSPCEAKSAAIPEASAPEKARRSSELAKKKLPGSARCPSDVTSAATSFLGVESSVDSGATCDVDTSLPCHDDDDENAPLHNGLRCSRHGGEETSVASQYRRPKRSSLHKRKHLPNVQENSFDVDGEEDDNFDTDTTRNGRPVASCFASYQVHEDSVSSISSASYDYADEEDAKYDQGVVQQIEGLIAQTEEVPLDAEAKARTRGVGRIADDSNRAQGGEGDWNSCAEGTLMDDFRSETPVAPVVFSPRSTANAVQLLQRSPPSVPSLMSHTKAPSQLPASAESHTAMTTGFTLRLNAATTAVAAPVSVNPPLLHTQQNTTAPLLTTAAPAAQTSRGLLPPTYPTTPAAPTNVSPSAHEPSPAPPPLLPRTLSVQGLHGGGPTGTASRRSSLNGTREGSTSGSMPTTVPAAFSLAGSSLGRPPTLSPLMPSLSSTTRPSGAAGEGAAVLVPALPMQRQTIIRKEDSSLGVNTSRDGSVLRALPVNVSANEGAYPAERHLKHRDKQKSPMRSASPSSLSTTSKGNRAETSLAEGNKDRNTKRKKRSTSGAARTQETPHDLVTKEPLAPSSVDVPGEQPRKFRAFSTAVSEKERVTRCRGDEDVVRDAHATSAFVHIPCTTDDEMGETEEDRTRRLRAQYKSEVNLRQLQQQQTLY